MGLDCYLTTNSRELTEDVWEEFGDTMWPSARKSGYIWYGRKTNAIHRWFLENCGGNSEMEFEVDFRKLRELRDVLEKVVKDRSLARYDLETMTGFFFGSQEYDDYYFSEAERMLRLLDYMFSRLEWEDDPWSSVTHVDVPDWEVRFWYRASW